MTPYFSKLSRDEPQAQKGIMLLIYTGWALTLLYFPSGFLLFSVGSAVYLRDILFAGHLTASLIWLYRLGDLRLVMRQSAILFLIPLLLIPAVADADYRFEALRTVKWSFFWLDWIILGHFVYQNRRWDHLLGIFVGITAFELVLEWMAGAYESFAGHYLFTTPTSWNERTIFGVQAVKDLSLAGLIRVRGLQRDVFSFANLMAMSAVLGLSWATVVESTRQRVAAFIWAAFFAVMLVVSGGRSALFGIFASTILAIGYVVSPRFARKWSKVYLLAWVAIAIVISCTGVGALTDAIAGTFFGKSKIGDSTSAYMRDDNWNNLMADFELEPIILVTGGPVASLMDSRIAPMFHWADNQILWNIYHLGLVGALAIAFYFFRVIWTARATRASMGMDLIILCLLFVVGEGIARESLTFMGCMPLFIACGYVSAGTAAAASADAPHASSHKTSSRRRRRSNPLPSS